MIVVAIHNKYIVVAMARDLWNIFLHCFFGPHTKPVEQMEMILPSVYNNANDGMSRFTRARLENNDVILPKQKQNAKPYQRCLQLSAGIHPSSLFSNNIFEHTNST